MSYQLTRLNQRIEQLTTVPQEYVSSEIQRFPIVDPSSVSNEFMEFILKTHGCCLHPFNRLEQTHQCGLPKNWSLAWANLTRSGETTLNREDWLSAGCPGMAQFDLSNLKTNCGMPNY